MHDLHGLKAMSVAMTMTTNELNRVTQLISMKYKMVNGFNLFRALNFKMFPILDLSSSRLCSTT